MMPFDALKRSDVVVLPPAPCSEPPRSNRIEIVDRRASPRRVHAPVPPTVGRQLTREASLSSTSPWQGRGAHLQTRSRPRSSCSASIRSRCDRSHFSYAAITASRSASRLTLNGFARLLAASR
jgi:hypothetical protein